MVLHLRHDDAPRALAAITAVVINPRLAENLSPKATLETGMRATPGPLGILLRLMLVVVECMRGGTDADDRTPRVRVVYELRHLLRRQVPEPREDHHQVRVLQRLETGNVVGDGRVHLAVIAIDGEKHRAMKPMPLGENPRHGRHRFLGPILLIAGDEHDALAFAGTKPALVSEPLILGGERFGDETEEDSDADHCANRAGEITKHIQPRID